MQRQQNIGKANWLLNSTIVGGCHLPLWAHQDPRSRGVVPTHSLSILTQYPNSTPLGIGDRPTLSRGGSRVPIRLRPQNI